MFESHFRQIGFYLGNTRSEKMTSRNRASVVNINKDGERTCDTDVHEAPYQNSKYTGGAVQEKKAWNTVRVIPYQFYLYINVISLLCNPNGTLFQTCLILHVWLKSIILVFLIQIHFFHGGVWGCFLY
jgi:hypothetical protein